jgi:hypothetical protein
MIKRVEQPSPLGAKEVLENFAGNPDWNAEELQLLIDRHVTPGQWTNEPVTTKEVKTAMRTQKKEGARNYGTPSVRTPDATRRNTARHHGTTQ